MLFNLNEFLIAVSFALDFIEMDIFGVVTNHSKRVAYISMRIAEKLGLSEDEIFDIVSLAILHDNGASEKLLHDKLNGYDGGLQSLESYNLHCIKGEENIKTYPFLTNVRDVIKYHHENYDGSGFFKLSGDSIPVKSQIIRLADIVELNTSLKELNIEDKRRVQEFVKSHENSMFSPKLVEIFLEVSHTPYFWLDMKDEFINASIKRNIPCFSKDVSVSQIRDMTQVFSKIIDSKSKFTQTHSRQLSEKAALMGELYRKPSDEIYKLMIAADLHDIGKLAVSNTILDKTGKLDEREFDIIKQHSYYTRLSLQEITGFEDITEWASNHHEKLNGKGYPFGKTGKDLDFNSRLMACLDIYQALMEERPYRKPMLHNNAVDIMQRLANEDYLDGKIVYDIKEKFSGGIKL